MLLKCSNIQNTVRMSGGYCSVPTTRAPVNVFWSQLELFVMLIENVAFATDDSKRECTMFMPMSSSSPKCQRAVLSNYYHRNFCCFKRVITVNICLNLLVFFIYICCFSTWCIHDFALASFAKVDTIALTLKTIDSHKTGGLQGLNI